MASPMDNVNYNQVSNNNVINAQDMQSAYKNAMQNPKAFEEYVRRTNPKAYDMAVKLAQSRNPRDIVMQILNSRGINPSMFGM